MGWLPCNRSALGSTWLAEPRRSRCWYPLPSHLPLTSGVFSPFCRQDERQDESSCPKHTARLPSLPPCAALPLQRAQLCFLINPAQVLSCRGAKEHNSMFSVFKCQGRRAYREERKTPYHKGGELRTDKKLRRCHSWLLQISPPEDSNTRNWSSGELGHSSQLSVSYGWEHPSHVTVESYHPACTPRRRSQKSYHNKTSPTARSSAHWDLKQIQLYKSWSLLWKGSGRSHITARFLCMHSHRPLYFNHLACIFLWDCSR